jgi:NitT/TauT family transport system permease protein
MPKQDVYFSKHKITMVALNRWDVVAIILVFCLFALLAFGAKQMTVPYQIGEPSTISLSVKALPMYALHSVLRMFIALLISILFTFIFGTLAAKNKHAERIIIPLIDILQSVPVLGFLSIGLVFFINLFHGSLLGPICAAIFVIFTSQVWNIILSFYQSLKTIPYDLIEAADILQLSAWQRFWRIEVPFAMPGLLWNIMMSMSGSWFFVVASEAISVANQNIMLPGIGSYIAIATKEADMHAIFYAIITMLSVILIYDQLLFRPLVVWADKFKAEGTSSEFASRSWMSQLLQRTYAIKYLSHVFDFFSDYFVNFPLFKRGSDHVVEISPKVSRLLEWFWYVGISCIVLLALYFLTRFIFLNITWIEVTHVFYYGFITAVRVTAVVMICTLIWVPLGVWIGMRPRLAEMAQPVMQFLAAFPANLLFPLVVYLIVKLSLNVNIWVTPLMLLGTQWYIAFNVIAGTIAIPKDLKLVSNNFGITGWLRWKRLILPAIFPFYITGAITAAGGAWNVSILAEVVSWGQYHLTATGLGAYIAEHTTTGDFPRIALGISIMSLYVLFLNRIIWRPLYTLAQRKFKLD